MVAHGRCHTSRAVLAPRQHCLGCEGLLCIGKNKHISCMSLSQPRPRHPSGGGVPPGLHTASSLYGASNDAIHSPTPQGPLRATPLFMAGQECRTSLPMSSQGYLRRRLIGTRKEVCDEGDLGCFLVLEFLPPSLARSSVANE